ncbi:MAG: hypothetical protein ACYS76_04635 [Planctomycetota bacterium]|jgi:hypothetical protein
MRFDKRILTNMVLAVLPVCLLLLPTVLAQSGGPYVLEWSTIDGGGGISSGGDYVLTATIGQPEAGAASGGDYELLGGFLPGGPLCFVDFDHFASFAQWWLETGSGVPADLDGNNDVDWADLGWFVDEWLYYCPYDWPLK